MAYNLVVLYLITYWLMKITLIITTYNWPQALLVALESINEQTLAPDEVIIADDGSTLETKKIIKDFKKNSDLNIIHILKMEHKVLHF